jgi:hypothetical protein
VACGGRSAHRTINGFAVHPANAHVMLVAMRDGIFRSDNGGSAWTAARGALKNAAAVTFNPGRPSEAYAVAIDGLTGRSP